MNRRSLVIVLALSCALILGGGNANAAPISSGVPSISLLVTGPQGGSGSTIGPDVTLRCTPCRLFRDRLQAF
jgi:hypothetical protein